MALVADEFRKLATHTAASANQIKSLVDKLNKTTLNTVSLMNNKQIAVTNTHQAVQDVYLSFNGIEEAINNIFEKSFMIANAATQQSHTIDFIANYFTQTTELARQTISERKTIKLMPQLYQKSAKTCEN